jgi:hypothetical protein
MEANEECQMKQGVSFKFNNSVNGKFTYFNDFEKANLLYAQSEKVSSFKYHGSLRGFAYINIYSAMNGENWIVNKTQIDSEKSLVSIHASSMFLSYGVIFPSGIFVIRYLKFLSPAIALRVHQSLMTFGMIFSQFAAVSLYFLLNHKARTVHAGFGIATGGVLIITPFIGYFSISSVSIFAKRSKLLRVAHKLIGHLNFLLGLVATGIGSNEISTYYDSAPYFFYFFVAWFTLWTMLYIVLGEFRILEKLLSKTKWVKMIKSKYQNLESFEIGLTWPEILQKIDSGADWIVIDGHFYDVGAFYTQHPGGDSFIQQTIGTDASKIFTVGPYAYNNKELIQEQHFHSFWARRTLQTLIVGNVLNLEDLDVYKSPRMNAEMIEQVEMKGLRDSYVSQIYGKAPCSSISWINYTNLKLVGIKIVDTHTNTPAYTFKFELLDVNDSVLCMPGDRFEIININNKEDCRVSKQYCSSVSHFSQGILELYVPVKSNSYMSHFFQRLYLGQLVRIRGPISWPDAINKGSAYAKWDNIYCICDSDNVFLALNIVDFYLSVPSQANPSKIRLLVCWNKADSLMMTERIDLTEKQGVTVFHHCKNPPPSWSGLQGNISSDALLKIMGLQAPMKSSPNLICESATTLESINNQNHVFLLGSETFRASLGKIFRKKLGYDSSALTELDANEQIPN